MSDTTTTPVREPIRWATYPGDHRAMAGSDRPVGPSTLGEWFWPVTADYDQGAKKTRVGFSLIPPATIADKELSR